MKIDKDDHADEVFAKMIAVTEGEAAVDVVYALGMMIAHGIKYACTDKTPETTFSHLREIVAIELLQD